MSTDTWADLEHLAGIDLTGAPACQWVEEPDLPPVCEQPAEHVMVQHHTRPPFPCHRLNLCTEHKAAVIAGERDLLRAGATGNPVRLICTLHLRQVVPIARWERL